MKFFATILLVAFAGALVKAGVQTSLTRATVDKSLINYLLQPSASSAAAADPALANECFTKYLPILSDVGTTFSMQYQACITMADERMQNLTSSVTQTRTDLIQDTDAMCNAYQACANGTDILGFFNCYATTSTQDVSQFYSLATNATDAANSYSQGLQLIQQDSNICKNTTENTYVADTAATYEQLDDCLLHGLPVDEDTTEAPIETTVQP